MDAIDARRAGEIDVEQHDIRFRIRDFARDFAGVGMGAGAKKSFTAVDQRLQAFADAVVVINDRDADWNWFAHERATTGTRLRDATFLTIGKMGEPVDSFQG